MHQAANQWIANTRATCAANNRPIDDLWPVPELDAHQEDASSRPEKPEPEEIQPGAADSIRHIVFIHGIQIMV
jgi:hypothetical protein